MSYTNSNYIFESFDEIDINKAREIFELRISDNVRKWMQDPDKFSFENHISFIHNLNSDRSKSYFYVTRHHKFVGVYSIVDIDNLSAKGGFYMSKEAVDKGLSFEFLYRCIDFVFNETSVHTLYGYQKVSNKGAYALNKLCGFYESKNSKFEYLGDEKYQYGELSKDKWADVRDRHKLKQYLAVSKKII